MTDSYFSLKPQDQRGILQTAAARLSNKKPDSDCQTGLRSDYEAMQRSGMMYDQPVPFDDLISSISDLESRVNDWSAS